MTDSAALVPPELAARHGVEIVPLTVTLDGTPYLDGADLGADEFYARFERGTPAVTTAQPSPGRFAQAYRAVAERGAEAILSIHADGRVSGTVNAARLGAGLSPVPVQVVETATASFGVACCVWEAAQALDRGATGDEAAEVVKRVGEQTGNVFVVRALDLARAGGRLKEGTEEDGAGIPVLTLAGGVMEVVDRAGDVDKAAEIMASWIRRAAGAGQTLRVGVGLADRAATPLRDALEQRLAGAPEVAEVVRYRVGPSVGAHTGPGTVGAMFYPSPSAAR